MSYKIKKVTTKTVEFDPPLVSRNPTRVLSNEKFGVTDAALALIEGNEFEKGAASYEITGFGTALRADTGPVPAVDRNPYNFVAFAGKHPWATGKRPAGHDVFRELNGCLEFEAEALTPSFVPAGFPFAKGDAKPGGGTYEDDDLRGIAREFCTLLDADGNRRYAIPGSSFKGALRSAVEALANSRMGVADKTKLEPKHLYRRRVFTCGVLKRLPSGDWSVQEIEFPRDEHGRYTAPNKSGLLAWFRAGKPHVKSYEPRPGMFHLSKSLADGYTKNIEEHAHYRKHHDAHMKDYDGLPADWRDRLANLHDDDVIYCAVDSRSGRVQNFGRNVNYLWPAGKALDDLVRAFLPRESPDLDEDTDVAEQLFGFTGEHDNTHPFRGLLRFETMWGPDLSAQATEEVLLAPLTSPASQGKSRPLYLAPGVAGLSASFDDADAEARGRKFYWHQRTGDGRIWGKHTFQGTGPMDREFRQHVKTQCPPPIQVLPAGVKFRGRVHFSNLAPHALGALLFALQGDGSYDHAFHLGKAKARGLGSFRIKVTKIEAWRIADRYRSLSETRGRAILTEKTAGIVEAFRTWCAANAQVSVETSLHKHPHIQDFVRLHTWPSGNSVRYYPLNFSQYSWLPADNHVWGEPKAPRTRPPAMRRARDIAP